MHLGISKKKTNRRASQSLKAKYQNLDEAAHVDEPDVSGYECGDIHEDQLNEPVEERKTGSKSSMFVY